MYNGGTYITSGLKTDVRKERNNKKKEDSRYRAFIGNFLLKFQRVLSTPRLNSLTRHISHKIFHSVAQH